MKFRLDIALGVGLAIALALAAAAVLWGQEKSAALAQKQAEVAAANAKVAKAASDSAERLKAREAELRASMEKELASRDVEIGQLRGQLAVRVMDRILFRSGSAEILPAGEKVLGKLAPALASGNEQIHVEGHTDNVRISEKLKAQYFSNWELSTARAASVVRYFQVQGRIDPKRLEAVGYGEYRPVAPNDSAPNRRRNRRVEIILTAHGAPHGTAAEPTPAPAKN
ncbi:MAG: OmpA family protein [Betaproteobacteria bacterium]|nr:OmpA family protein [Betaproteobacteria bacterium]